MSLNLSSQWVNNFYFVFYLFSFHSFIYSFIHSFVRDVRLSHIFTTYTYSHIITWSVQYNITTYGKAIQTTRIPYVMYIWVFYTICICSTRHQLQLQSEIIHFSISFELNRNKFVYLSFKVNSFVIVCLFICLYINILSCRCFRAAVLVM